MRVIIAWLIVMIWGVGLAGCGDSNNRPINPGTFQVDIKVWRVLAIGDSTTPEVIRCGCRLTTQEIQQIVGQLQSSASIFGGSTTFAWDGQIADIVCNFIPTGNCTSFRAGISSDGFDFWISEEPSARWNSTRINIYFGGNFYVGNPIFGFGGETVDPAGHINGVRYKKILISDLGFTSGVGSDAQRIQDFRILEHEMTHYLARFANRTFGMPPNQRTYNAEEHLATGPSGNILAPNPPHPLVIPGSPTILQSQQYEIYQRIQMGLWNSATNP